MIVYEISLKFEENNQYPKLNWAQLNSPVEGEMLKNVLIYAKKYQVPLEYIESKGLLLVEPQENGLFDIPEVYQVDFRRVSRMNGQDLLSSPQFENKYEEVPNHLISEVI